jgi:PadR family transcriptional regulator PadR
MPAEAASARQIAVPLNRSQFIETKFQNRGAPNGLAVWCPSVFSWVNLDFLLDKAYTSCYDVLHIRRYAMDIQLKRGLLDVSVLAAIKNEDSYGYKIIKDLKPYVELSESTLYTILKRLEAAELLTVRTAEYGGRLRKYYHITPAGRQRIADFKEDWQQMITIYQFVTKEDPNEQA